MVQKTQTSNGRTIFIALVIMICSILAFFALDQREHLDNACTAIIAHENTVAKSHIDKIKDVNAAASKNKTMLMVACESGNSEIIEYLLDRDADVNYTVDGGLTPLELFCSKGYEAGKETLLMLLKAGANQEQYTQMQPILHLAQSFDVMTEEQLAVATAEVIVLLQRGAPLKYETTSLLHLAAKNNMADFFYTIVHSKKGLVLLSMEDQDGKTPWEVAVSHGAVDVQRVIRNLETEFEEEQNKNNKQN